MFMLNDKKVKNGTLRFVVMSKIGKSFVEDSVEVAMVDEVLNSIGAK